MHKFGHWSGSALIGFCLATATALAAAPDSAGPPLPLDPQLQTDAREYGFSLFQVIAQIEQDYVRPVSRADLVEAAVTGLYEAVRRPVPPNAARRPGWSVGRTSGPRRCPGPVP